MSKAKPLSRQTGFTLIELLLYVAILGSLLFSLSQYFVTTASSRVKNQSIAEVDQQGALAMEYITQTIRGADSITSPTTGASGSSLTLVVPTGSLSPTIFDNDNSGGAGIGALQVKEGIGSYIALTNAKVQISSLTFKNLSRNSTPGVIQVSFTISRLNQSGRNEYTYQKTFTASAALRP